MKRDGSMASAEYEDYQRRIEAAKQAQPALFEVMRAIYNQATAQGFFLSSFGARWHFGHNPTRDLIAANMD